MNRIKAKGPRTPVQKLMEHLQIPVQPPSLNEADILKARDAFIECDTDGSGYLEAEELVGILKRLGIDMSLHKMKELMEPYDLNGDGKLVRAPRAARSPTRPSGRRRHSLTVRAVLCCLPLPPRPQDLREFIHVIGTNSFDLKGKARDELHTDALIDTLGIADESAIRERVLSGAAEAAASDSPARTERMAPEKLADLEERLRHDFGLPVSVTDVIPPPVTEEKLRQFLLSERLQR